MRYERYYICIDPGPERSGGIVLGVEELQELNKPTILWTSTGTVPDASKKKGEKVVHNHDNETIFEIMVEHLHKIDADISAKYVIFLMEKPEFRMAIMDQNTMGTIYWTGRFAEKYRVWRSRYLLYTDAYMVTPSSVRLLIAGKRHSDVKEVKACMETFFGDGVTKVFHSHVYSSARLYMAYWMWYKKVRTSTTPDKKRAELLKIMEVIV